MEHISHHYNDEHDLQRVVVWKTPPSPKGTAGHSGRKKHWVIYIHGGGWRDPAITAESFLPTIQKFPPSSLAQIAGFASVDYRLSAHPKYPQDATTTPPKQYRKAVHPEHVVDARAAIAFLQKTYDFGDEYVLLGHSAGATMALQLLMGSSIFPGEARPGDEIAMPSAIIGLSGIYDLTGLAERMGSFYAEFIAGAFGEPENWNGASPMKFAAPGYGRHWRGGKPIIMAWSTGDELIDEPEVDGMIERLEKDGVNAVVVKEGMGSHDGMWEDGEPLARLIVRALEEINKSEGL